MSGIERLARIRLNSRSPDALAAFFIEGLGFSPAPNVRRPDGASTLRLGASEIELTPLGPGGRPYPADIPGWSPLFQHFAIVTADIAAALARLERAPGWTAITRGGPQRLPPGSGGVTAFKFRDPEGHPLELLAPPGEAADSGAPNRRIDHSAISVRETSASVAFYRGLGLTVGARTLNRGPEQARLDGLADAEVDVTALEFADGRTPHIELLAYRGDFPRDGAFAGIDDVAATRLILTVADLEALADLKTRGAANLVAVDEGARPTLLLRDPDGHILQIEIDPKRASL